MTAKIIFYCLMMAICFGCVVLAVGLVALSGIPYQIPGWYRDAALRQVGTTTMYGLLIAFGGGIFLLLFWDQISPHLK